METNYSGPKIRSSGVTVVARGGTTKRCLHYNNAHQTFLFGTSFLLGMVGKPTSKAFSMSHIVMRIDT